MTSAATDRDCAYAVDALDVIVAIDENWLAFARENGAPQLTAREVVGQPLFRYLDGDETRQIYRLIIDRVRRDGQKVRIPFRCDGPTVRRFMELDMEPLDRGGVGFVGRLLREEFREHVPLFDAAAARSEESVAVCPWCKFVRVEDRWLEVELAVAELDLFASAHLPRIRHDICSNCSERIQRTAVGNASE